MSNFLPSPEQHPDRRELTDRFKNIIDWLAVNYDSDEDCLQYGQYSVLPDDGPVPFDGLVVRTRLFDDKLTAHSIALLDDNEEVQTLSTEATYDGTDWFSIGYGPTGNLNHNQLPPEELHKADKFLSWVESQLLSGALQPDEVTRHTQEQFDEHRLANYLVRSAAALLGPEQNEATRYIKSDAFDLVNLHYSQGILQIELSSHWQRRFPNSSQVVERTFQRLVVNRDEHKVVLDTHEHQLGTQASGETIQDPGQELNDSMRESRAVIMKRAHHALQQLTLHH